MATLKVMCARSMHTVVEPLARAVARDEGHEFDTVYGTVGALEARLDRGERADVVILSTTVMERLAKAGTILPASRVDVARTQIGVAVREGVPAPDISTPEAFRRTLLEARAVAFSDPRVGGSAGVYLAGLFERMGLADLTKRKGLPQPSGAEVARRVAEGAADLGLTLTAEIVPVAGARVIGPLPPPFGNETTYAAGLSAACSGPEAASALIARLTHPDAHPLWRQAGFEPPALDRVRPDDCIADMTGRPPRSP
jgi:molybdate transport system substrate-binding protein